MKKVLKVLGIATIGFVAVAALYHYLTPDYIDDFEEDEDDWDDDFFDEDLDEEEVTE